MSNAAWSVLVYCAIIIYGAFEFAKYLHFLGLAG
jgi:hypothetical protein